MFHCSRENLLNSFPGSPPLTPSFTCLSCHNCLMALNLRQMKRKIDSLTWEKILAAHLRGASLRQAARVFGIPAGTVLSHFCRSNQRIRKAASGFTRTQKPEPVTVSPVASIWPKSATVSVSPASINCAKPNDSQAAQNENLRHPRWWGDW